MLDGAWSSWFLAYPDPSLAIAEIWGVNSKQADGSLLSLPISLFKLKIFKTENRKTDTEKEKDIEEGNWVWNYVARIQEIPVITGRQKIQEKNSPLEPLEKAVDTSISDF